MAQSIKYIPMIHNDINWKSNTWVRNETNFPCKITSNNLQRYPALWEVDVTPHSLSLGCTS